MNSKSLLLGILVIVLLLTGCANFGPSRLQASRNDYNIAIQRTGDEQLLLNLVRLKYRDTPLFLEVSSVSSQFTFQSGIAASGSYPDGSNTHGLGASVSFSEKPTVTFSPLQGEMFVQRVLAPIELDTILLLTHSGWRLDRLLWLCAQRLNGLKNAPSASGPTPAREPVYKKFKRASAIFRALQLNDGMHLGYGSQGGVKVPMLHLTPNADDADAVAELVRLLKLKPGQRQYQITADVRAGNNETLSIGTRSFLGVMFFMSQAVEVPESDQLAGKVTLTVTESGEPFNWSDVMDGILRVHSQAKRPESAAIAVPYRGHWFYVDDSDLESKSSFSLLSQLFALQAGKSKGTTPMLTLPVGG